MSYSTAGSHPKKTFGDAFNVTFTLIHRIITKTSNFNIIMNVGFLLYKDAEELDIVGPWEVFTAWSQEFHGPENCLTISQSGEPVSCSKGMVINANKSFENCPNLDILIVPGGKGTFTEIENAELNSFVQEQAKHCSSVLSVCTGSFLLHKAGLLKGMVATTYWDTLNEFRKLDSVETREERFILNEQVECDIWTSAGVSAGIDMSLAFIEKTAGEETAGKVQLWIEYYPSTKKYGKEHLRADAPAYAKSDSSN